MIQRNNRSLCGYCHVSQYYFDGSCQDCNCPESLCLKDSSCLMCSDGQYINLDDLKCQESCQTDQIAASILINATYLNYCRDQTFFIDPTSKTYLELGTLSYPYKSLQSAFKEIFTVFADDGLSNGGFTFLIKENTTVTMRTLYETQFINEAQLVIRTYSDTDINELGQRSTIYIQSNQKFQRSKSTYFSLMDHQEYSTTPALTLTSLASNELELIYSLTDASFIAIRSDVSFQNFLIKNDFDSFNEDFLFMFAWDVQEKRIQFDVHFFLYGGIFESQNPLNFYMTNSIMQTDWLNKGIRIVTDCTLTDRYSNYGEIVFHNYTQQGERYLSINEPLVFLNTINNITVNNSTFKSYAKRSDAYRQQLTMGTVDNCKVAKDDGRTKIFQFTNIYITMETAEEDTSIFFYLQPSMGGDILRNMSIIYENVTVEHVYSFTDVINIGSYGSYMVLRNFAYNNVSQSAEQLFGANITGSKVFIYNFTFKNSKTEARILFLFFKPSYLFVDTMLIENVTLHIHSNTNTLIKQSTQPEGSYSEFNNIIFQNNYLYQNQAVQQDRANSKVIYRNCLFQNETLQSNAYYLGIFKTMSLQIYNTTFRNFKYDDVNEQSFTNTFILRYDSMILVTNKTTDSILQNISIENCKTNFFQFKGYVAQTISSNDKYYLRLDNLTIKNNEIDSQNNFIIIDSFVNTNNVQIVFSEISFSNNTFLSGGNLIKASQNDIMPMIIQNCQFINNTKAQISLQASDKISSNLPLLVLIQYSYFIRNQPIIDALFRIMTNSKLQVINSHFEDNFSNSRGSIFFGDYKNTTTYVYNSTFISNYAYYGGVFFIHFNSYIEFDSCLFKGNLAMNGGVGRVENQGSFKIQNSKIISNQAHEATIISVTDAFDQISYFGNTSFSNNKRLDSQQFKFLDKNSIYMNYIQSKLAFLTESQLNNQGHCIVISKAKLYINEGSLISQESNFISGYASKFTFSNSTMADIEIAEEDYSFMTFTQSEVTFLSSKILDFTYSEGTITYSSQYFINLNLQSTMIATYTEFKEINVPLIFIINSALKIYNSKISNVDFRNKDYNYINIDSSSIIVDASTFSNISSINDEIISVSRSQSVLFTNNIFISFNKNMMYLQFSTITITNSKFQGLAGGSSLQQNRAIVAVSSTLLITNSQLLNLTSLDHGGAIELSNGHLTVEGTLFQYNEAQNGGALALLCSKNSHCLYTISKSYFYQNTAEDAGGAIYYNKNKPDISVLNVFDSHNRASYGDSIASYPYSVRVFKTIDNEVASGQEQQDYILAEIIDAEGQRVSNDNSSDLAIDPIYGEDADIIGKKIVKVVNGVANFTDLIFIAKPRSKGVKFIIQSTNINNDYIKEVFNLSFTSESINQAIISINFRKCSRGEIEFQDKNSIICLECEYGTYSLAENATECISCPENAICEGRDVIRVLPNYWRRSINSTLIHKCLIDGACIGGTLEAETSENKNTICNRGYGGYLCNSCVLIDGDRYARSTFKSCAKCADNTVNYIFIQSLFLALFGYLSLMIYINLIKKKSESAVEMRILTNYLQILAVASQLNLNWPNYLIQFYAIFTYAGDSVENLLSVDCLLPHIFPSHDSTFYFKAMAEGCLPFVYIFLFAFTLGVINICMKQSFDHYKRSLIVAIIIIIYVLHPTISKFTIALFFCLHIEDDLFLLQEDLQIQCWVGDHLKLSQSIGIPVFVVIVIGMPIGALIFLICRRKDLQTEQFQQKWIKLYSGLETKHFYWEFANVGRKVFLVALNVFLQTETEMFKAMVALLFLFIFYRIQIKLHPYKNLLLNKLEQREILSSLVTFLGALFFVNNDFSNEERLAAFVLVMIFNSWFFSLWIYCLLTQYQNRYLKKIAIAFSYISLIKWTRVLSIRTNLKEEDTLPQEIITQYDIQRVDQQQHQQNSKQQKQRKRRLSKKIRSNLNVAGSDSAKRLNIIPNKINFSEDSDREIEQLYIGFADYQKVKRENSHHRDSKISIDFNPICKPTVESKESQVQLKFNTRQKKVPFRYITDKNIQGGTNLQLNELTNFSLQKSEKHGGRMDLYQIEE